MADAQVADAEREAETPPEEEPLSEDEEVIDRGGFSGHHGFPATGKGSQNLLKIYRAMVGEEKYKKLPKGNIAVKADALDQLMDKEPKLRRRILKHRHDAIKRWNKDRRAEQEESESDSSVLEEPAVGRDEDIASLPRKQILKLLDQAGEKYISKQATASYNLLNDTSAGNAAARDEEIKRLAAMRDEYCTEYESHKKAHPELYDASDDGDSAASSEPDLSKIEIDDVQLPASVKKLYETDVKLCVHYRVDFSQFSGKGAKLFRKSDFTNAWQRAKGVEIERRTTSRQGAGQQKEEQKRCGECGACLSMSRPPPGCSCYLCSDPKSNCCAVVYQKRENPPRCEKLAQANLPEIGEDEQGGRACGDPTTLEFKKLEVIAELIRDEKPAGGDLTGRSDPTQDQARAVLNLAAPGMPSQIGYVSSLLGDDTTNADLGEHVAEHLRKCDYLDDDEDTRNEMICAVREAAKAPDVEPEPPASRSIMHRRAWIRIANALYPQQRGEILALPKGSEALTTWLRKRAQFAVVKRREQAAMAGALSDWTIGQAAAVRELQRNPFGEKSKGERYNNTEPFRLARNEFGRTDVTDNVQRLRETGPPPPSSRKKKK